MKNRAFFIAILVVACLVFWLQRKSPSIAIETSTPASTSKASHISKSQVQPKPDEAVPSKVENSVARAPAQNLPAKSANSKTNEPEILKNEHRIKRWEVFKAPEVLPLSGSDIEKHKDQRKKITFNFFNEKITLNRLNERVTEHGVFVWTGVLKKSDGVLASLSMKDGVLIAEFGLRERHFGIRHDAIQGNILMEVDTSIPLGDDQPVMLDAPNSSEELWPDGGASYKAPPLPNFFKNLSAWILPSASATPKVNVDIMVLGRSVADVLVLATNHVNYTNVAFQTSGVHINLRLVYAAAFDEPVQPDPAAFMPPNTAAYKSLLKAYKPDRVMFLQPSCYFNICGRAGIYYSGIRGMVLTGWAGASASASTTFAHEFGHIMGAAHDDANAGPVGGTYEHRYAKAWRNGNTGDIMSYAPIRLQRYSAKDTPYGDALDHDAARVMNENAEETAEAMPVIFVPGLVASPVWENKNLNVGGTLNLEVPKHTRTYTCFRPGGNANCIFVHNTSTYVWKKDGVVLSGQTSKTLSISNLSAGHSGTYSVTISHEYADPITLNSTVSVGTPATAPTITTHPLARTVTAGAAVSFTVAASGTAPMTYTWSKNGVAIPGATGATYTIANAQSTHQGNYRVTVTNARGSATSNSVALVVLPAAAAPVITAQPSPLTVIPGTSASFSVTATGTNLTYQWLRGGAAISGARSATYTVANAQSSHAGNYSVRISNSAGTVNSNTVLLTVNIPPVITTQPTPKVISVGGSVFFSVAASGTQPLTYQWYKSGAAISGAVTATYAFANAQAAHAGNYSVKVTNMAGVATSNSVPLTVQRPPVITTQPIAKTVVAGTATSFTVVATGENLTYQWSKTGTSAGPISGATGPTYFIANTQAAHAGNYAVRVTNAHGAVSSNPVALTVQPAATAPRITTQPVEKTVIAGTTTSFIVVATGTNITYQWFRETAPIAGATGATYTISRVQADHAGQYSVKVINSAGTVTSNSVALNVQPAPVAPTISVQPISITVNTGTVATFSVVANGTAALSYEWFKGAVKISGATTASYSIPNVTTAHAGTYSVKISNSVGSVTSNNVALTVQAAVVAPAITTQPLSRTVIAGSPASFTVVATGTSLNYQWFKGAVAIAGANSATYTIANVQGSHAGNYSVAVSNRAGSTTSNTITLSVEGAASAPKITTQPRANTVVAGSTTSFNVVATGSNLTYQWLKNGNQIIGATSATYSIVNTQASHGGNYSVRVSNLAGTATSNSVALIVNQPPVITSHPISSVVPLGANHTLKVTATGTPPLTYVWKKNGTVVSGATAATLTLTNTQINQAGNYMVEVSNSVRQVKSSSALVKIRTVASPRPSNSTLLPVHAADFVTSGGLHATP